jgi:hypothetical protein
MFLRAFIGFMVACLAPPAMAQEVSDTVLRAAYCAGVLAESIKGLPAMGADTCSGGSQPSVPGYVDLCAVPGIDRVFAELRQAYERRRSRYVAYLKIRSIELTPTGLNTALAATEKGKRDARAKMAEGMDKETYDRCRGRSGAAFIDCAAPHDGTHASILRCEIGPDNLPF